MMILEYWPHFLFVLFIILFIQVHICVGYGQSECCSSLPHGHRLWRVSAGLHWVSHLYALCTVLCMCVHQYRDLLDRDQFFTLSYMNCYVNLPFVTCTYPWNYVNLPFLMWTYPILRELTLSNVNFPLLCELIFSCVNLPFVTWT